MAVELQETYVVKWRRCLNFDQNTMGLHPFVVKNVILTEVLHSNVQQQAPLWVLIQHTTVSVLIHFATPYRLPSCVSHAALDFAPH